MQQNVARSMSSPWWRVSLHLRGQLVQVANVARSILAGQ
jgi:hypothetical protein